jgi:hypothetical protein
MRRWVFSMPIVTRFSDYVIQRRIVVCTLAIPFFIFYYCSIPPIYNWKSVKELSDEKDGSSRQTGF